jgi:DNA repair protein RecO (recombination protein O)
MSLLVTDAIVLHAFPYLESSRILRLATREAGLQSVIAKGARRASSRFGSALDLFAQGSAHVHVRPARDLQTLSAFEVVRARPQLAESIERFAAASAIAEVVLRFTRDDSSPAFFDTLAATLDELTRAEAEDTREVALRALWRIIAELGFAPSVDDCASCHAFVPPERTARFSHPAGGVLCDQCSRSLRTQRSLPPEARASLRSWLNGDRVVALDSASGRAHQRLFREFLQEHVGDNRPLLAYESWERGT